MPCYKPLKAFILGTKNNGKKEIKICGHDTGYLELINGNWYPMHGTKPFASHIYCDYYVDVPCGKCIGCRLDYSRQWADRCMLELEKWPVASFVTFTYNDLYVPKSQFYDNVTGELGDMYTLRKRDIQLFIKRLRKKVSPQEVRYFLCGEYGDNTHRPHYHLILFNYFPNDAKPLKTSSAGFQYFTSDELAQLWPFGYNLVTEVSWETCAYVARYVMKKRKGSDSVYYTTFNIEPEFTLMSRKPGIGKDYFYSHSKEMYESDRLIYSTPSRGITTKIPRYFDKLMEQENPEAFQVIKDKRIENAMISQMTKEKVFHEDYFTLLQREEQAKKNSIKALSRPLD